MIRATRRYVRAYLRWEVDRASTEDVRTLLALSTSDLASTVFGSPPRRPNGGTIPAAAKLVGLRLSRESQVLHEIAVDARISRSGRPDQLNLVLVPTPGGVRVTELIPPDGV